MDCVHLTNIQYTTVTIGNKIQYDLRCKIQLSKEALYPDL
jgi:hypothetical protein